MQIDKYKFTGTKKFDLKSYDTKDPNDVLDKEEEQSLIKQNTTLLEKLLDKLAAEAKNAILIIIQGTDAAGKDGAIRHVFSGLNPQNIFVHSFKQPTTNELAHDYLWRTALHMPPRGKLAVFNRSYYEDVLIGKVHKLYKIQNLPDRCKEDDVIEKRYTHIKNLEEYLWDNGITVLKFFLHISKEEQKQRFIERISDQTKNWKFTKNDVLEREFWDDYQKAYEIAINETATKRCPWFIIPADKKWFARLLISEVVKNTLEALEPQYPKLSAQAKEELNDCGKILAPGMS